MNHLEKSNKFSLESFFRLVIIKVNHYENLFIELESKNFSIDFSKIFQ